MEAATREGTREVVGTAEAMVMEVALQEAMAMAMEAMAIAMAQKVEIAMPLPSQ